MGGPPERPIDIAALERPAEGLVGADLGVGEGSAGFETAFASATGASDPLSATTAATGTPVESMTAPAR
jgi:hypothetical protein